MQREIDERRKALGYEKTIRWTGKHLEALTEIVACAAERPHLVKHALDAFSQDDSQRKYSHLPAGLVLKWDSYAESQQEQRRGRLASARSYFEHRCFYLAMRAERVGRPSLLPCY